MAELQISAEIHHQQTILTRLDEVSEHKTLRRDYRAVNFPIKLHAKCRICVPELQQIAMQSYEMRVLVPFIPVQSTGIESVSLSWIRNVGAHLLGLKLRKLGEKFCSTFMHQLCQFGIVIGEEQERLGRTEFLPLK